jgi:hypothetical protein
MIQPKGSGDNFTQRAGSRHVSRWLRVLTLALLLVCVASGQLTTNTSSPAIITLETSDPQGTLLATQAQSALSGATVVSDIKLSAQSAWFAGSARASGSATLKVKGALESRLDITAGASSRSEIRNDSGGPGGQWIDSNGIRHAAATHNCWTPAGWFAPHAVVQGMLDTNIVLHYVGRELRGGISVDHVQLHRTNSEKNQTISQAFEKLSSADVFFDASTHLPQAVIYNTHPDNDYGRDIPVEIKFSDYRSVNGVMVPYRIQRLLQGVLNLDLTVSTATVNSGLTDGEFALQ